MNQFDFAMLQRAREALEQNIDAAQRELDMRAAQGEDVSGLAVNVQTGQIVKVEPPVLKPLPAGAFAWWDNPNPRRGW